MNKKIIRYQVWVDYKCIATYKTKCAAVKMANMQMFINPLKEIELTKSVIG